MNSATPKPLTDAAALQSAVQQAGSGTTLLVQGTLTGLKALKLPAGCTLKGEGQAVLKFKPGQPGIRLEANTRLEGLRIEVDEPLAALTLADEADDLGEIHLHELRTVGRVHLEGSRALQARLHLRGVHVERADARMVPHRPAGYGVEVLMGAINIYNFSKNPDSRWQLKAEGLSCGSAQHPVRGSGVMVFGGDYIPLNADLGKVPAPTQPGGQLRVDFLSTGEIHSDGGIAPGTPNLITGGVFVGSGVHALKVQSEGPVTTRGVNDMVLDNWGRCDLWVAQGALTSHNTSGIGFVNFGDLTELQVNAPIETFGLGARGFNLYDGTLQSARFQDITTHGDGAIGIQLAKPFGRIHVRGNVLTTGGSGDSLVRGQIVHLSAHALSLKPGTQGESLVIDGTAKAENADIDDLEFVASPQVLGELRVNGKPVTG